MKPNEIKAALALDNVTCQDIATELGITRQIVGQVVRGEKVSKRVMMRIAEKCRKKPGSMWGVQRFPGSKQVSK